MIRIDQRLFWRAPKEIIRMVGQELIQRAGRSHQDRQGRVIAASCPAGLLPGARDGSRISHQDRRAQAADIDSQLKRVGSYHGSHRAIPQTLFDLAALTRQVSTPVTPDSLSRPSSPAFRIPGYLLPANIGAGFPPNGVNAQT